MLMMFFGLKWKIKSTALQLVTIKNLFFSLLVNKKLKYFRKSRVYLGQKKLNKIFWKK